MCTAPNDSQFRLIGTEPCLLCRREQSLVDFLIAAGELALPANNGPRGSAPETDLRATQNCWCKSREPQMRMRLPILARERSTAQAYSVA